VCFDKRDMLVYSPIPFLIGFVPPIVGGNGIIWGLLLSVVIIGLYKLRSVVFPRKSNGSSTKRR